MKPRSEETFFEQLASIGEPTATAPARLKSKIYTALMRREAESGSLRSLSETHNEGRELCVFEKLVVLSPVPESAKCPNFCLVCHARILAESIENAPIYWHACPYVSFQKR